MILEQDKKTITFGFDFLKTTVELDATDGMLFKSKKLEYYTVYRINLSISNKEEIHSYFEKHYMNKVEFPSYSECLKELILDFFEIPESYEIKRYKAIVDGTKTSIRLNTKEGDVWILQDLLLEYGDTYKDGIYTIFRNVKDYYNRDENMERTPSMIKKATDEYKKQTHNSYK